MTLPNISGIRHKWTQGLWQRAILFSVGYFICAWLGKYLSAPVGFVTFWMPAGLCMAVLLLSKTRDWPWLLLAILPANFLFDYLLGTRIPVILGFYLANVVEALVGAFLVRALVSERPELSTLKEFLGLVFFGAILNSLLGAFIGAATLVHFGLSHSFPLSCRVWWGSNVMAILILTSFILVWFAPSRRLREVFNSRRKIAEAVLLLILLALGVWFLVERDMGVMSPNKSLAVPLLLWAGLRFGPYGATAASLFISVMLSVLTTQFSFGVPAALIASGGYVLVLQTVLVSVVLVSLVPAIVLAERNRTMAKLRESEERYRDLTEASFEGICITENGRFLDANEQVLKMFGCRRDELIGHEVIEMVAPESRTLVAEAIRTGREEVYEHLLLRKDGSSLAVETRARMASINGRRIRMTAMRDITARRKVEQALRESEEKFSKAFRTGPDVMSITDLETGRYLEVNDAHVRTFGYSREEVIGRSPTELGLLFKDRARDEMLRMLGEHGRFTNLEVQALTRDGRTLTFLTSGELVELGGRQCVLRVTHDITDRKRAEEALRESERRFRSYFELASVGFSVTSREMKLLAINDEYCRILGYAREELLAKNWAEITHPEDLDANKAVFEEALAGKRDAYTVNKRMVRKDGTVIYTTMSARCVRQPDGSPDYFVSLLLDTTEREQAIQREQHARAAYTLQLIASQEAERERIAGELHDSLGQSLSIIKNHAQLVLLQKKLGVNTRKQVETINETTTAAIAEMRRISQDLHPYQLDHLGLTRALNALVESTGEASGIVFKKKFDLVDDLFSRDAATNLYRIAQEGLNNILKYSGAKNARIILERDLREVRLLMEDDGRGFTCEDNVSGMGLKNIAERTRILGGHWKLETAPGQGVRVEIMIPISAGAG